MNTHCLPQFAVLAHRAASGSTLSLFSTLPELTGPHVLAQLADLVRKVKELKAANQQANAQLHGCTVVYKMRSNIFRSHHGDFSVTAPGWPDAFR